MSDVDQSSDDRVTGVQLIEDVLVFRRYDGSRLEVPISGGSGGPGPWSVRVVDGDDTFSNGELLTLINAALADSPTWTLPEPVLGAQVAWSVELTKSNGWNANIAPFDDELIAGAAGPYTNSSGVLICDGTDWLLVGSPA